MGTGRTLLAQDPGEDRDQGCQRPRLRIATHESPGERLAGPAIRCWELAKALSSRCSAVLAAPGVPVRQHPGVIIAPCRRGDDDAISVLASSGPHGWLTSTAEDLRQSGVPALRQASAVLLRQRMACWLQQWALW
jgi:hypothetical protein